MQFIEVSPHPTRGWLITWFRLDDRYGKADRELPLASTFKKKIALKVGESAAKVLAESTGKTVEMKVKNLLGQYTEEGRTYGYDNPEVKG